jgi:hypothetical protein
MKIAWHFVIRIKLPDRQKATEVVSESASEIR